MANTLPPIPTDTIGENYKWREWFNVVRNSIIGVAGSSPITHNSLTGIQGGVSTERYHFTQAQYTDLLDGGDSTLHYHASDRTFATGEVTNHVAASDPHTQYQKETEKNAVSGYAGLDAASRITKGADTTDDIIIDLATKGLVLKDTQGTPHYWRLTVSTLGVLTTTDLGTGKP